MDVAEEGPAEQAAGGDGAEEREGGEDNTKAPAADAEGNDADASTAAPPGPKAEEGAGGEEAAHLIDPAISTSPIVGIDADAGAAAAAEAAAAAAAKVAEGARKSTEAAKARKKINARKKGMGADDLITRAVFNDLKKQFWDLETVSHE